MRFLLTCLFLIFSACGEIPPPDALLDAQNDFIESHIDIETPARSCENEGDLAIMHKENHYFAERWNANSGIAGLDEQAMRADFPTISDSCLRCVARFTKCAVGKCGIGVCDSIFGYGPKHVKCRECSNNACGAEMIKCSGLLPAEWPDFYRGQL